MTRLMWCSTRSTVTPRRSRIARRMAPRVATSSWLRPPAGSSTSRSLGLPARARASSTRLSVPNGRPAAGCAATRSSSRKPMTSIAASRIIRSSRRTDGRRSALLRKSLRGARVHADHHVLEHGHAREQREVLERAADAERGHVMRGVADDRLALEDQVAAVRRVEPAHAVEQRGLARAVRADQPDDVARAPCRRRRRRGRRYPRSASRRSARTEYRRPRPHSRFVSYRCSAPLLSILNATSLV